MKNLSDETAGQKKTAGGCIPREQRRNVGIALPVYQAFSRTCAALGLVLQQEATKELDRWNRRHAKRAKAALAEQAKSLN